MKKCKGLRKGVSLFMVVMTILAYSSFNVSAADIKLISDDTYIQQTGIPDEVLESMDEDFKAYIANDLKSLDQQFSRTRKASYQFDFVQTEVIPQMTPRSSQVLSGINFTAYAFKSGSKISIYPTYEFTNDKRPRGRDAFSFQLSNAMRPYAYGGQVWYKDSTMSSWAVGGSMTANTQNLNGAVYSGSQLGSPDWSMKMKGCAWVHADVGTGTDKRIAMGYAYNPNQINVSVSLSSSGAVGISFSSGSGTIYTAASTIKLSY